MRTNTTTNSFFYDFLEENRVTLTKFVDLEVALTESRTDPILQGTNGVLTAGFILTFLACFTGFLIYWTLSIKSRVLQFGVFNAMGMTKRNLINMLIYEQILISLSAIVMGVIVGEIASFLFVPLIQIAYSPALQVIPLMILIEIRDYINIFSIIGLMVIICLNFADHDKVHFIEMCDKDYLHVIGNAVYLEIPDEVSATKVFNYADHDGDVHFCNGALWTNFFAPKIKILKYVSCLQ
jgi:hypothetical protein